MKFFLVVLLAVVSRSVIGLRPTGKVVTVESFVWNLQEPSEIKINAKSPITIDFVAQIAPQSDSINGKNLWRLGIFGSEHNDGHGERVGFKSQILKPKQASKRPRKGRPLKMRNIFSRFDLSQIGCSEVRYFCVEFAKNPDSTVEFELRSGAALDSIVSCKEMECRRPNANATLIGPKTLPAVAVPSPTVRLSGCRWSIGMMECPGDPTVFNIGLYVDPHPLTDNIRGSGLWRVGIFLSNAIRGRMVRSQWSDMLTVSDKSKPLISGERLVFSDLQAVLNTTGVGCPGVDLQYICLEFAKGENAIPDFQLLGGPRIRCIRLDCSNPEDYIDPEELPTYLPAARVQNSLGMEISIMDACEDSSNSISMNVQVGPHPSTDTIRGSGLWRLGVFLSNATTSPMAVAQYKPDLLNATHKAKPLIAGELLRFDDLHTNLHISSVGCPESFLQYLCLEFDKGENPSPDFQLPEGRLVDCIAVNCRRPRKCFADWFGDRLRAALRGNSPPAEE